MLDDDAMISKKRKVTLSNEVEHAAIMIGYNNSNHEELMQDIDLPLIEDHSNVNTCLTDDLDDHNDDLGDNDNDVLPDDLYGSNDPTDSVRKYKERRTLATVDGIRSINQRIKENAYEMEAMNPSGPPFLEYRRINDKDCLWCSICSEVISAHKSHVKGHINTKYHSSNKMKVDTLIKLNLSKGHSTTDGVSIHDDSSVVLNQHLLRSGGDINDVTTAGNATHSIHKLRSRSLIQQSTTFIVGQVINDNNTTSLYKLLEISPIKSLYKYNNEHSINLAGGIPLEACFPIHSMEVYLEDMIGEVIAQNREHVVGDNDDTSVSAVDFSHLNNGSDKGGDSNHSTAKVRDSLVLTKNDNLYLNYQLGQGMPVVVDWVREHVQCIHRPPIQCGVSLTNGSTDAWFKVLTMIAGDCVLFDEYAYSSAITPCQCLNKQTIGEHNTTANPSYRLFQLNIINACLLYNRLHIISSLACHQSLSLINKS